MCVYIFSDGKEYYINMSDEDDTQELYDSLLEYFETD